MAVQPTGGDLVFQWFKDGVPLTDVAGISGSETADLSVSGVDGASRGAYSVHVSNPSGSDTSREMVLTVFSPPEPNDAELVSHTVPESMSPGQSLPVSVTVRNTSAVSWNVAQNFNLAILEIPGGKPADQRLFPDTERMVMFDPMVVVGPAAASIASPGRSAPRRC